MKKVIIGTMVLIAGLLLTGCGGGGSSTVVGSEDEDTSAIEIYKNKKLPTIKNDTIPDILLVNSQFSNSKFKQKNESSEISSSFLTLKEKANFFYQKQLEMNIDLSYIDSIWPQIEEYCQDKDICNIPNEKIIFTYTEALYKHDIALIKEYEEKTGDYNRYKGFDTGLESLIGKTLKLSTAKLTIDENADYKYELTTENINPNGIMDYTEISIVKWSEDNSKYLIREEVLGSSGDNSYHQFQYTEIVEEKTSRFMSNNHGFYDESLEFIEKDGTIYFVQDQPNDNELISFYIEGYLDDDGGKMTVIGAGETYNETFDSEGNLLTSIQCWGIVRDLDDLSDADSCRVQNSEIVKSILVKNVYALSSAFWGINDFQPTSVPDYKTMVKFDENNTLFAIVNCSTFTAKYKVGDHGISFTNVEKNKATDLQCLYPQMEDNFEQMLYDKLSFVTDYFDVAYGLWPNFNILGSASDFNITKFKETLYSEMFVDSPLMNSVFNIKSSQAYFNVATGKYFTFMTSPIMKVENEKIIIELIDATFDADIEVVDGTHIKFNNINRINKSNVIYPVDHNSTCISVDGCMDSLYSDSRFGEKIFADIVEEFLNETVKVYLASTSYNFISFEGSELVFTGSITPVAPMVEPLILTVGTDSTKSIYRPHGEPVVLSDGTTNITNVSVNKEGIISLSGADADLFSLNGSQLSFVTEVNASNPLDTNEDGIYELEIQATDNDGQTVRYNVWYKVYIPGTIIAETIQDMVGVWDFSEGYNRKHYLEILLDGSIKVHDYNDISQCFESDIAGIALRNSDTTGVFEEYSTSNNRINLIFTTEIRNDTLVRTHTNNFSNIPDVKRALESTTELVEQACN